MSMQLDFKPPIIAHRGARVRAPENTLAAFAAARQDGALWIETDVKLTSDGVPILFHDDMLERTTNGKGAVADMPYAEIQKLDAGLWFDQRFAGTRVPTLAELMLFARSNGTRLNLEIKPCPGRTKATAMVALIEAAKLWPENAPPLLISSFDVEALVIAAQLHPGWPRGLLLDTWRDDWQKLVDLTQASSIHLNVDLLTAEHVAVLRQARLPILAYTVNDPAKVKELMGKGIKAVFSDNPALTITT
jgi:glycerophosphoryl diester phosphodiesterase